MPREVMTSLAWPPTSTAYIIIMLGGKMSTSLTSRLPSLPILLPCCHKR